MSLACAPVTSSWRTARSSCFPSRCPRILGRCGRARGLWGWPHCIQNEEITQLGVDLRLTLIAFEAMNHWHDDGSFSRTFHKQPASPVTARCCTPCSSSGPPVNTAARFVRVSSVSVCGRRGHRPERMRRDRRPRLDSPGCDRRCLTDPLGPHGAFRRRVPMRRAKCRVPLAAYLAQIRHRGQLRAPGHRRAADVRHRQRPGRVLSPGSLIIDVVTMARALSWARPTSFTDPMFTVGGIHYYAVDHSPSLL